MELQELYERSKVNASTYRLISFTLVALMIACAVTTVVILASEIVPGYAPFYLVLLCFLVAIDRLYSYRISRPWMFLSREWFIFFGSHAIVIIAITKITVSILSNGWDGFLQEIPTWHINFPLSFITYQTGFALVLVTVTWFICGHFAELLEEIGPDQIQNARLDLVGRDPKQNIPARQRLIGAYFWVGTWLVIVTMLSRIFLRSNLVEYIYHPETQVPAFAVGGATTLLYFMLGLALLSQTQFISLHIRWNIQRIPVSGKLARQWAGYSLLFLGLIAFTVGLLPTSYGLQPLTMVGYAISLAVYFVLVFAQWIFYSVAILINLLFGRPAVDPNPIMVQPEPPTPQPGGELPPTPGGEMLQTIIFWAVFLAILFFAVRQYLRQNQELLERLLQFSGWRYFLQFRDWLKSLLTQAKNTIEMAVNIGRERARQVLSRQRDGDGYVNPRKLDPRHRVYFFYLAFVRRAGESGLPRSSHQTPDEYAATLQNTLPENATDIQSLTEAFSAARYSRQPVEKEQSQRVEGIWSRVRRALRGKRSIR